MPQGLRKTLPYFLIPLLFIGTLALIEYSCSLWLMDPSNRRDFSSAPSPYFPWEELRRLAREDKTEKGNVARELISLGVEKYEFDNFRRDYDLLSEPRDFAGHLSEQLKLPLFNKDLLLHKNFDDVIVQRGITSNREKVRYRLITDSYHRRITNHTGKSEKENLVFLGCSFTFGEGLETEDTFPSQVGELLGVNTYNLGTSGGSPARTFTDLRKHGKILLGGINEKPVTLVYTYIDHHIQRVAGSSKHLAIIPGQIQTKTGRQYYLENGELRFYERKDAGFFEFLWFRYWFGRTAFAKAFNIDIPFINDEHFELLAKLLVEVKREAAKYHPSIKTLLVVFYPGQSYYVQRLIPFLEKENIPYLDLSAISPRLLKERYYLPADPHPSGELNRIYSHFLARELRKTLND